MHGLPEKGLSFCFASSCLGDGQTFLYILLHSSTLHCHVCSYALLPHPMIHLIVILTSEANQANHLGLLLRKRPTVPKSKIVTVLFR